LKDDDDMGKSDAWHPAVAYATIFAYRPLVESREH